MSLLPPAADVLADGLILHRQWLLPEQQNALVDTVRDILRQAPLYTPVMPRTGTPFPVRMSNCGALGWVSDIMGYRYQDTHPETGLLWPAMPDCLLAAWDALAQCPHKPEACLINWYDSRAKMGLHQDRDEEDMRAPVLSLSLGDTCLFRYGGTNRWDPTRSVKLESGDALLISGASRLCFHGVDRLYPGTSTLLPKGGRINLTLRRVTRLQDEQLSPNAARNA